VRLREGGDAGEPIVLRGGAVAAEPDAAGAAITALARDLARRGRGLAGRKLSLAPRDAGANRA